MLAWIDYRNFPGGPIGFFESSYLTNVDIVALTMVVLGNILADSLLVSKYIVVCNDICSRDLAIALPMSRYLGSCYRAS